MRVNCLEGKIAMPFRSHRSQLWMLLWRSRSGGSQMKRAAIKTVGVGRE